MFGKLIVLFCLLVACSCMQNFQFTANVAISQVNYASGTGSAKLYYDSSNQLIRNDYFLGTKTVKEILDYTNSVKYEFCGACAAYTITSKFPRFYLEDSDVQDSALTKINNDKNVECLPYKKVNPALSGNVSVIWVTNDNQKLPCKAMTLSGTSYVYSQVSTSVASTDFQITKDQNCPSKPQCKTPIDLVLVMDQSGSIHRDEWKKFTDFALLVVNSFVIGPEDTQIGLVYFSGVDYKDGENPAVCCGLSDPVLPLNFDKKTIEGFLINHNQTGGHTCIGCGINSATTYEPNPNRGIQVPRVMLVVTDGFANRMTAFLSQDIANAKAQGWDMYAVGVGQNGENGNQLNPQQLDEIASEPKATHSLYVDSFDQLLTIVQGLTKSICTYLPESNQCGPFCQGNCVCKECLDCYNFTAIGNCKSPQLVQSNGNIKGCFIANKTCDPNLSQGDLCKIPYCDEALGCTTKAKDCTSTIPDPCFTATCDPAKGCVYTDSCAAKINIPGTNTPSLCLNRICDAPTKTCSTTPVVCPPSDKCNKVACDNLLGCVTTPVNCDDGNRCTVDTCDPKLGCQYTNVDCTAQFKQSPAYLSNATAFNCFEFVCDPKVGCTSSKKSCDDGNACTLDSCDPKTGKCINSVITCQPDPTDLCSTVECDALVGCVKKQKVVCNDNKACTTDKCNPATGACEFTPVVCPSLNSSKCAQSVCDETAGKCIDKPTVICSTQPSDVCQATKCDETTGTCTASVTLPCPPKNCSIAVCDPKGGCTYKVKNCSDNNICTEDKCDPATNQCINQPIPGCVTQCPPGACCKDSDCPTTDPCKPQVCENKQCIPKPVVCETSLCSTVVPTAVNGTCQCVPTNILTCPPLKNNQCGENLCDPTTGKCTVQGGRVCNDNDPCTNDLCELQNGKPVCVFTSIQCTGNSACSRKKCINNNGSPLCVIDTANSFNCSASTECATATCDETTGTCVYTPNPCSPPSSASCERNVCNPATRKCEKTTGLVCTANDPVGCGTDGVCVVLNGKETCTYQPVCPVSPDICTINSCVPSNSTSSPGTCSQKSVNCNDNDPCTKDDKCVPGFDSSGNPKTTCSYLPFICPVSTNPCTINKCVNVGGAATCVETTVTCAPKDNCTEGQCQVINGVGTCVYTEKNCGNSTKCGSFVCDPATGQCSFKNKCQDNNLCTDDICDPNTGACTFKPKVCNSTSVCKNATCDPNVGCIEQAIDCATLPNISAILTPCLFPTCLPGNGCQVSVIPNSLDACGFCNKPGKCKPKRSNAGAVAGGIIAGGVVAGCAAVGIGVFASFKGWTAPAGGTDSAMTGAYVNPTYADNGLSGTAIN